LPYKYRSKKLDLKDGSIKNIKNLASAYKNAGREIYDLLKKL
jgi:hypothetical protein